MLAKASAEGFRRHYSNLYSGQYIELSMTQKTAACDMRRWLFAHRTDIRSGGFKMFAFSDLVQDQLLVEDTRSCLQITDFQYELNVDIARRLVTGNDVDTGIFQRDQSTRKHLL